MTQVTARRRSALQILTSIAAALAVALALVAHFMALALPVPAVLGGALGLALASVLLAIRGVATPSPRPQTPAPETIAEPTGDKSTQPPTSDGPPGLASRIGRYTLEERLAVGGMGEVWRASHDTLLRPAALKVIRAKPGQKTPSRESLERFRREAMVTSSLTSPHTVDLFDFGVEGATLYLAMELLDGMSLLELVEKHGPLAEARVVYLLRQACHSLIEAHEMGVVHRDIKPENLLLTRAGRDHDFVKVIDFGLVKQLAVGRTRGTLTGERQAPGRELTAIGARPGTPGYMAPEQIEGDGIDQRADIYALACVAYYAVTGHPVFEGTEDGQLMFAHMAVDPDPPSERIGRPLHPGFEAVIMRCLAKNPLSRPHTMAAMDQALAELDFDDPWTPEQARRWWAAAATTSEKARRLAGTSS
jgi:serine/threonine protein kinase